MRGRKRKRASETALISSLFSKSIEQIKATGYRRKLWTGMGVHSTCPCLDSEPPSSWLTQFGINATHSGKVSLCSLGDLKLPV